MRGRSAVGREGSPSRGEQVVTVLDTIGRTRLVPLRHIVPERSARILIKLECENPTGSMKDRMALAKRQDFPTSHGQLFRSASSIRPRPWRRAPWRGHKPLLMRAFRFPRQYGGTPIPAVRRLLMQG